MFLSTFLIPTLLLTSSLNQSYSINIPTHLDLSKNGTFNISINESELNDNQVLNIIVDDTFTLSDKHGRGNIVGSTSNNHLTFSNTDMTDKTVSYSIENSKCGIYEGNINIDISIETNSTPNILISGPEINTILKTINPTTVTFSHDVINSNYSYDLSKDKDESILLYINDSEVIISNGINEKIIANENMSNTFKGISSITTINNIDYLDTSNTTNMSYMFKSCTNLESIDVSSFNTSSCTNMAFMFDTMSKCTSIGNISNWDVSNVTSFENFLYYDMKLSGYGDLSNWKVSNKCTNLKNMFAETSYTPSVSNSSLFISTLDLSGWDVSNVTTTAFMFKNASNLQTLDISNWNTSKLTSMEGMFYMADTYNPSKLTTITGLENLDVSNVTNMDRLFYKCQDLSASGFENWKPYSLTKMNYCFYYCKNMDISGLENWNTYFVNRPSISNSFKNAGKNTNTSAPSWAS